MWFQFDDCTKTVEEFALYLKRSRAANMVIVRNKAYNPAEFLEFVKSPENKEEVERLNKVGIFTRLMSEAELLEYMNMEVTE